MKSKTNVFFLFNIALVCLLIAITIVFWVTNLDIVSMQRYHLGDNVWSGYDNRYLSFFYYPMNAIIFAIPLLVGFPLLFMSLSKRPFFERLRLYRHHGILLVATTMLGAGLFNSVMVKIIFARPRPDVYFNGDLIYYRPFEIAIPYWGLLDASFPSGHVSIAFVLIGFFFIFYQAPKRFMHYIKWIVGVGLTLFLGISMIISRMSYGAHYLSDGIWGGAFTYFFALGMYYLLKIPKINEKLLQLNAVKSEVVAEKWDIVIIIASIVFSIAFSAYFIFSFSGLTKI